MPARSVAVWSFLHELPHFYEKFRQSTIVRTSPGTFHYSYPISAAPDYIECNHKQELESEDKMQRVKNIEYLDDDVYSDEDECGAEEPGGYSAEDKENFASLTPVVRAELDEAGVSATTKQIEDALWHYYWDVGKSVAYLKNSKTPQPPKQQEGKKEKPKSKFDEAAEQSAVIAGECHFLFASETRSAWRVGTYTSECKGGQARERM